MSRVTNVAASVDQRLRNLATQARRPIADVRTRYVLERFLYRLSLSPYRDANVMKAVHDIAKRSQDLFEPIAERVVHQLPVLPIGVLQAWTRDLFVHQWTYPVASAARWNHRSAVHKSQPRFSARTM